MSSTRAPTPGAAAPLGLVVLGLVGVGFSLRSLMAALPPLEPALRTDLGLSGAEIGVLTTLPVLCMGLLAPVAARVGHRFGAGRAVGIAMVLVALGNLLRGLGELTWPLYLGTLVAGVGIALAGTLMPGLVKGFFPPQRTGLATGLSMLAMMGGAGVASAVSVPLADELGSWALSLGLWGVVAAIGLVVWLPVARLAHRAHLAADRPGTATHRLPWRSRTAWLVAAFMACQSVQFYSTLAWLAPTYVDERWTPAASGLLLSVFTGAQLVSGLVWPWLTDKVHDWRVLLLAACVVGVTGELGVWLAPTAVPWIWALLLGIGQGAAFALGLVLLVRYAVDAAASARFTALCFLICYTTAAIGPTALGAVRDATGSDRWIWAILVAVMVPQAVSALVLRPDRPKVS
ncbi:MAG: MFS transporter [Nostocoides sp.]